MYLLICFFFLDLSLVFVACSLIFPWILGIQGLWLGTPTSPQIPRDCRIKASRPKLDSSFISDVNVLDGTLMAPSTPFTKIWRMRNSGNIPWPRGAKLWWIGGDKFSDAFSVEIEVGHSISHIHKCFCS